MNGEPWPPEADPYDDAHRVVFSGDGEPDTAEPAPSDQQGPLTAAKAANLVRKVIY